MSIAKYDHKKIEESAQRFWKENKTFEVSEDSKQDKFYCLSMFPYPRSAAHGTRPKLYFGRCHRTFSAAERKKRDAAHGMGRLWTSGRKCGN